MGLIINGVDCIDIDETAEKMNTTIPRILMLIKHGALKGWMIDGTWYVSKDSISACPGTDVIPHAFGGCGGCASKAGTRDSGSGTCKGSGCVGRD